MSARRRASWWLAGAGLLLALALFLVAQPRDVVKLALSARWTAVLAAFALTGLAMLLRGLRLSLLSNRRLAALDATAVAAASQLATGVLPARVGEIALVPLVRAAGMPGAIRALSLLVLMRVLDVSAVLAWTAIGAAAVGGRPALAVAALGGVAVLAGAAWLVGVRGLRRLARRWRDRTGWRRRALRQLLRVRGELLLLARAPTRAAAGMLLSLALWGVIWAVTVTLLRGMALDWPPVHVLLGVVGAAFGAALPINAAGNFGTQEAGWAAALAAVGVAPKSALAAGFACHVWGLLFTTAYAGVALAYLAAVRSRALSSPALTKPTSAPRSERGQ